MSIRRALMRFDGEQANVDRLFEKASFAIAPLARRFSSSRPRRRNGGPPGLVLPARRRHLAIWRLN